MRILQEISACSAKRRLQPMAVVLGKSGNAAECADIFRKTVEPIVLKQYTQGVWNINSGQLLNLSARSYGIEYSDQ
ncbi:hypothetical protein ACH42_03985 [Endozoicomonas sp. (ex Bugula neritina AB1)]|nr:hypothetical protein ACH42_03985 [Endozoicomonas sp. (ex Bugula neritina AB1)]